MWLSPDFFSTISLTLLNNSIVLGTVQTRCARNHVAVHLIKSQEPFLPRLFLVLALSLPYFWRVNRHPRLFTVKANFGDLVEHLVGVTDRLITGSHGPTWVGAGKQRLGAVPLSWSAAVRMNHDVIIQSTIECVVLFLCFTVIILTRFFP